LSVELKPTVVLNKDWPIYLPKEKVEMFFPKINIDLLEPDGSLNLLKTTKNLRNFGGIFAQEKTITSMIRPGIYFISSKIAKEAFGANLPIGGYGKEQYKYLSILAQNPNIFVIMDDNPNSKIFHINQNSSILADQKTGEKENELKLNTDFENNYLKQTLY